jgi:hypothetical protein
MDVGSGMREGGSMIYFLTLRDNDSVLAVKITPTPLKTTLRQVETKQAESPVSRASRYCRFLSVAREYQAPLPPAACGRSTRCVADAVSKCKRDCGGFRAWARMTRNAVGTRHRLYIAHGIRAGTCVWGKRQRRGYTAHAIEDVHASG